AVEERIQSVRKAAAEIPSVDHDAGPPPELREGALLIEVEGGMRTDSTQQDEIRRLGCLLDETLRERSLGQFHGLMRIPECSTLIYYGSDSEAMYTAIEPTLTGESQFAGALVTIRQGSQKREVTLPGRLVN